MACLIPAETRCWSGKEIRGRLATGRSDFGRDSARDEATSVEVEDDGSQSGYKFDPGPQKMMGVKADGRAALTPDGAKPDMIDMLGGGIL